MMSYERILKELQSLANPGNAEGMARYGISSKKVLGLCMPDIERIGKEAGRDHALALRLWDSGIYEARILAALVDEPGRVTEAQMEEWAGDFDSWAVCDNTCMKLFGKTPFAYRKAAEWSSRTSEFEKRAGFALMATLSVHDKKAGDGAFIAFLGMIKRESRDERNYVRKAVNWALRQIGKRSMELNGEAIKAAEAIGRLDSKPARWIAADALRELRSQKVHERLKKRQMD